MKDEFFNRLEMFKTVVSVLRSPQHEPTWLNQPPTIFTTKEGVVETDVTNLDVFCGQQGVDITGAAKDKKREREEMITVALRLGSALDVWFIDHNDETSAAEVDLTLSEWQDLRDQPCLETARLVRDKAQAIVAGPDAAAAVTYGITAAEVTSLTNESDDFANVIVAPQVKIAGKKSLTEQLRARFNAVERQFEKLDKLILQFGATAAGRALILAYQAARTIIDRGAGPGPTPPGP